MEFLIGSPLSTPVGQRIERATSSNLQSEDWALNMEICDIINETGEGPKDAVKALKKRIVGNRNFREVMLALTVLEACVKNCGQRFHVLVASREFVEGVLVRAILPKNNPPLVLHDRVLSIIQAWADAFRSCPALTGVVFVYEDLRRKGLEFPMTELEGYSPIHTPTRSVPERGPAMAVRAAPLSRVASPPASPVAPPSQTGGPTLSTPHQIRQLKEDLVVVRGNLTVMSEMMSQLEPVSANHTDRELLQQLYVACESVQGKIVDLVPRLSEESLIEELLQANDNINTTFTRYHRFERQMSNSQDRTQQSPAYVNLIDLNLDTKLNSQSELAVAPAPSHLHQSAVDSVSNQMSRLTASEAIGYHSLVPDQQKATLHTPAAAESLVPDQQNATLHTPGPIPVSQASVLDDVLVSQTSRMDDVSVIERWLEVDQDDEELVDSEGVTSEEFDRFLAERMRAAERLPSVNTSSNTSQSQP